MANKNLTIFQRLGQILGPDGVKQKQKQPQQTQRYNIGNGELLKTDNKAEFDRAKLQAQQNKYLGQTWKKVENGLFQQSINYETTRIGSYADFEAMEFYPTIAAALDVMMEESTTLNDHGRMMNIYSDSKRVKGILEDLFFNRLDCHTMLPMATRNTPIREDSIIPLLDGTECTIKDLSNRIKSGEEIWSYAIQDGTKAIVPSKIVWCDLTRNDSELIRVTFDDGTHIDTTPDHEYMLRDGSYKRADELTEGQSLMPFYSRKSEKKKDCIIGYEKVYNPSTTKYKFTHSLVAHECVRDLEYEKLVGCQFDTHHDDFNKLNNHPKNLIRMTHSDHFKLHIEHFDRILGSPEVIKKRMEGIDKYLRSDERKERISEEMKGIYPKYFEQYNNSDLHKEHNEIRSEKMLGNWGSEEFIDKTKKGMTIEISDSCLDYISNIIINNENYVGINKLSELLKTDSKFIGFFKENYTLRKDISKSINPTTLNKVLFRKTNINYFDFVLSIKPSLVLDKTYINAKSIYLGKTKEKPLLNHKVVSIFKLNETSDVYCLEAVGPNGEHDRHNFPVCGKDINGSFSRTSGVFLSNCKYGDNFMYLNIDDKHGIIGIKQMPNYEMERREAGLFDMISGRETVNSEQATNSSDKVKFFWRGRDVEFNSWQMAHFRLLGDDRRLPYGTSVLEKSRRVWKQLLLSEDSMLVYRVTRAPERRVYKIYVGNIDDADVEAYVNTIADRFKRMPIVDPQTGQMDLRYNQLSNDQDYFIPVRTEDAPNPIDTLPGATNLDQIADIEYLQRNLFTSLRVPKPFLGFEEATGEGKNLALQDIRFSRTINRIQQAMLQELNKIAIIHLYILGFEEDLDNFTLTLNNPSTQAEMLKVEHTQLKVTLFKDAVSDAGNGFGAMSMTRAHREIMGWSDDEIKQDLLEQRMEKAASAELQNTAGVIKHTGMFDVVDRIYGDYKKALEGGGPPAGGEEGEEGAAGGGGGGLGGSFGGGGAGAEDLDFGDEAEGGTTAEAGAEAGAAEAGSEAEVAGTEAGTAEAGAETVAESINRANKLLKEQKLVLAKKLEARANKYKGRFVDILLDSVKPENKINEDKIKIYDKNVKINEGINNMIDDIDKMLDE
jgi:hypothetical protein